MMVPKPQSALLVAQSTALLRKAAAKLVKRGLGELWSLDSADEWFEKAKYAKSENRLIPLHKAVWAIGTYMEMECHATEPKRWSGTKKPQKKEFAVLSTN